MHCSIFKQSKAGLNSVFFLLHWLLNKPSLPYYLPIAERQTDGFMPFSNALTLKRETQTALSRI